jgi:hypothetical protein
LTAITFSAVQGGLLLAKTSRDSDELRIALDGAIAQLGAPAPPRGRRKRDAVRARRPTRA